jgi:hypothetical protein
VQQLNHLLELLQVFGVAYRLKVNYAKSNLIPINITEAVHFFTEAIQCQHGSLPFTYLVLQVSSSKPKNEFSFP